MDSNKKIKVRYIKVANCFNDYEKFKINNVYEATEDPNDSGYWLVSHGQKLDVDDYTNYSTFHPEHEPFWDHFELEHKEFNDKLENLLK